MSCLKKCAHSSVILCLAVYQLRMFLEKITVVLGNFYIAKKHKSFVSNLKMEDPSDFKKWDKSGTCSDKISVHFSSVSQPFRVYLEHAYTHSQAVYLLV